MSEKSLLGNLKEQPHLRLFRKRVHTYYEIPRLPMQKKAKIWTKHGAMREKV